MVAAAMALGVLTDQLGPGFFTWPRPETESKIIAAATHALSFPPAAWLVLRPALGGIGEAVTISISSSRTASMDNRSDIWLGVDAIKPRSSISPTGSGDARGVLHRGALRRRTPGRMRHQGFRVTENVADIPTAVMGEAGEGGPVIAILGEYDALPGLARKPASPSRPLPAGAMAMAAA